MKRKSFLSLFTGVIPGFFLLKHLKPEKPEKPEKKRKIEKTTLNRDLPDCLTTLEDGFEFLFIKRGRYMNYNNKLIRDKYGNAWTLETPFDALKLKRPIIPLIKI